jgi:hypothetical protein
MLWLLISIHLSLLALCHWRREVEVGASSSNRDMSLGSFYMEKWLYPTETWDCKIPLTIAHSPHCSSLVFVLENSCWLMELSHLSVTIRFFHPFSVFLSTFAHFLYKFLEEITPLGQFSSPLKSVPTVQKQSLSSIILSKRYIFHFMVSAERIVESYTVHKWSFVHLWRAVKRIHPYVNSCEFMLHGRMNYKDTKLWGLSPRNQWGPLTRWPWPWLVTPTWSSLWRT